MLHWNIEFKAVGPKISIFTANLQSCERERGKNVKLSLAATEYSLLLTVQLTKINPSTAAKCSWIDDSSRTGSQRPPTPQRDAIPDAD